MLSCRRFLFEAMDTLPPFISSARVGINALLVNPLRTVLSTLGVIIGVASLVAVLSLGDGMERMARDEIERTTDVQTVSVESKTTETVDGQALPVRDYPVFTIADAESAREVEGAAGTSLVVSATSIVDSPETGKRRRVNLAATLGGADEFMRLEFAAGRYFTVAEGTRGAPVIVLSNKTATELAAGRGAESMVGRTVRVQGHPMEVIGVLKRFKGEIWLAAHVPFSTAGLTFPPTIAPRTPQILVKARSLEDVPVLKGRVQDWVAERFARRLSLVSVKTSQQRLDQAMQGILIFKLFMGAITGISLLVGGIGIMNVLLASVTERTREIGIRKAIGARKRDILVQFLVDSVAISGAGSAIGVSLGLTGAFVIVAIIRNTAKAVYLDATFSWSTVLVAAISAIAVGLVFGTYPARRASRLSPIDAIRHE
jgi:putative ABC transport system permease protein